MSLNFLKKNLNIGKQLFPNVETCPTFGKQLLGYNISIKLLELSYNNPKQKQRMNENQILL